MVLLPAMTSVQPAAKPVIGAGPIPANITQEEIQETFKVTKPR